MENTVYHELAKHLDRLPGGFPPTPDGLELRILRRLFTEPEARLACHLALIPERAQVLAYRGGLVRDTAAVMLKAMWQKGLILKQESKGKPLRYMACQFVVGIWEFQVNRLDPGLVADMAAYIPLLFNADGWRRAPQMRTIPVNRSINPKLPVMPHEAAAALIRSKDHFVISPCICRKERRMAGHGCDGPLEACISFGDAGSYFIQSGIGQGLLSPAAARNTFGRRLEVETRSHHWRQQRGVSERALRLLRPARTGLACQEVGDARREVRQLRLNAQHQRVLPDREDLEHLRPVLAVHAV